MLYVPKRLTFEACKTKTKLKLWFGQLLSQAALVVLVDAFNASMTVTYLAQSDEIKLHNILLRLFIDVG